MKNDYLNSTIEISEGVEGGKIEAREYFEGINHIDFSKIFHRHDLGDKTVDQLSKEEIQKIVGEIVDETVGDFYQSLFLSKKDISRERLESLVEAYVELLNTFVDVSFEVFSERIFKETKNFDDLYLRNTFSKIYVNYLSLVGNTDKHAYAIKELLIKLLELLYGNFLKFQDPVLSGTSDSYRPDLAKERVDRRESDITYETQQYLNSWFSGIENEIRIGVNLKNIPGIYNVKIGSVKQDIREKIDLLITTSNGVLPLQCKSSFDKNQDGCRVELDETDYKLSGKPRIIWFYYGRNYGESKNLRYIGGKELRLTQLPLGPDSKLAEDLQKELNNVIKN